MGIQGAASAATEGSWTATRDALQSLRGDVAAVLPGVRQLYGELVSTHSDTLRQEKDAAVAAITAQLTEALSRCEALAGGSCVSLGSWCVCGGSVFQAEGLSNWEAAAP